MSPFSSDSNNMLEASRNPNEPVDAAEPLTLPKTSIPAEFVSNF